MKNCESERCKSCFSYKKLNEDVGECLKRAPLIFVSKETYDSLPLGVSRDIYGHRCWLVSSADCCSEFKKTIE